MLAQFLDRHMIESCRRVVLPGGPVLHRSASLADPPAPRLRTLVRPDQAVSQGDPQHAVLVVYEPDGRQFHHRPAPTATFQRVRAQLSRPGRSAHHIQQHSVAASRLRVVSSR